MRNTALLLLDYQVAMCDPTHGLQPALAAQAIERDVLARAGLTLTAARQAGLLIVHVRLGFDPSYELRTNASMRFATYQDKGAMLVDSREAQFMPAVQPLASEPIVTKGGVDPFIGTPLLELLVRNSISRVVLAGVATNLVVESAARHAVDSGLQVVVLEDLCASTGRELHEFAVAKTLPLFADISDSAAFRTELAA